MVVTKKINDNYNITVKIDSGRISDWDYDPKPEAEMPVAFLKKVKETILGIAIENNAEIWAVHAPLFIIKE